MRSLLRRPLIAFFGLAFAIAWGMPGVALLLVQVVDGFEPSLNEFTRLSYVSLWAPALAAGIVIGSLQGWDGVMAYVRGAIRPTGACRWYVAVTVGVLLVNLVAALGMEALGKNAMRWPGMSLGSFLGLALLRLTEGPMEELGWRGFALPLLQRRLSGLGASLALGFLWALWHVPAFVVGRSVGGGLSGGLAYVVPVFFLVLAAQSVLATVAYNATGGSVPVAILFHWMTNMPYPWETGLDLSPVAGPLWIGCALAVGTTVGYRYLGRRHLHTEVAPGVLPAVGGDGRGASS